MVQYFPEYPGIDDRIIIKRIIKRKKVTKKSGRECTDLTRNRVQWRCLVNKLMTIRVPQKEENLEQMRGN